jgi:hypothetical protein
LACKKFQLLKISALPFVLFRLAALHLDSEGGQSNAGHDVPKKTGLAKWNKTLEHRQEPLGIAWLLGILDAGHAIRCGRPFTSLGLPITIHEYVGVE